MSTNKKKPTRTCMGCNESKEKNELLLSKKNIIKDKDTQIAKFIKDRRLTGYFLQKFI